MCVFGFVSLPACLSVCLFFSVCLSVCPSLSISLHDRKESMRQTVFISQKSKLVQQHHILSN